VDTPCIDMWNAGRKIEGEEKHLKKKKTTGGRRQKKKSNLPMKSKCQGDDCRGGWAQNKKGDIRGEKKGVKLRGTGKRPGSQLNKDSGEKPLKNTTSGGKQAHKTWGLVERKGGATIPKTNKEFG